MNREELNWLLQTIKDAETAERFVLAPVSYTHLTLPTICSV